MDYLICVGGGGQHIALAIARMVRLGVWGDAPKTLVIDADLDSPLARRLRTFAEPSEEGGGEGPRVPHPLPGLTMQPPLATGEAGKSFRQSFLGSQPGGADNPGGVIEEELYELFYGPNADEVDIKQGMAARPSVGAAVFADRGIEHLGPHLEGGFSHARQVLIAASFIGGTGAGVTHQLVKYLHESPKRNNVDLFGTFLLPWIEIPPGGQGAADQVTIQNSAKHGIQHFMEETAPRLRKAMLVGANGSLKPTKAHDKQDETVSPFPLLAAYGLDAIMNDRAGARVEGDDNVFTVASDASLNWLLQMRWADRSSIAVRWAAARVFESVVSVFEDASGGVEFRKLEGDAFKSRSFNPWDETVVNWGGVIRTWAKKSKKEKDLELAAKVLTHLSARTRQLKMVTQYLREVFGTAAEGTLGRAGGIQLQSKYENLNRIDKEKAYRYLSNSFQRCRSEMKFDENADAPSFIAESMEQALMAEIIEGQVIS